MTVFVLTLGLLVVCRMAAAGANGGNVLVVAQGSEPGGLDPAYLDDAGSANVCAQIYEGLVRFGSGGGRIGPCLATSWSAGRDGKEWTFTLRRGVKFQDGTPFNAEAVKYNIDRQLPLRQNRDTGSAAFIFDGVRRVEAVNGYTVKIVTDKANAEFPIAMAEAPMVSPAAAGNSGDKLMERPVGAGPYRFVKWDRGRQIELTAFDGYWGNRPRVSRVVYKFVREASLRASGLAGGAVDIAGGVDPGDVRSLRGMKSIRTPGVDINYLGFYTYKKPFDNLLLRKVVSMAINREALADRLYRGRATAADAGILPEGVPGYDRGVKTYNYNPDEAKNLLAEAGYPGRFEFTAITYSDARPYNISDGCKLASAVQADLARVGVTMKIKAYPWNEYRKAAAGGEGDAYFCGWTGYALDANNFLMLLNSNQIQGGFNFSRYSNAQYDALSEQARATFDRTKRIALYRQIQQIAALDAPWAFISHSLEIAATRPNVKGFAVYPNGLHRLADVSKE